MVKKRAMLSRDTLGRFLPMRSKTRKTKKQRRRKRKRKRKKGRRRRKRSTAFKALVGNCK